jgi:hypothetical protein
VLTTNQFDKATDTRQLGLLVTLSPSRLILGSWEGDKTFALRLSSVVSRALDSIGGMGGYIRGVSNCPSPLTCENTMDALDTVQAP